MKVHLLLLSVLVLFAVSASAATINLGTAANFGLLGGSGVTNSVPGTVVHGDVGSSPTPAVIGFPPGVVVGTLYTASNAVTAGAKSDLTIAYGDAVGTVCPPTHNLTGVDLGTFNAGNPLLQGVYCFSSSALLTGTLVLDAQGDPAAQWIFQIGSSLTTATNANVQLINGASPCNVFWLVGSSATIQTNNNFVGTIMADASITFNGGTFQGRALARTGKVTTSGSEFVNSVCVPSQPCLSIIKQPNRATAAINDVIIYTFTVCNCGTPPVTVDSVTDTHFGDVTADFIAANSGSSIIPTGTCVVFTKSRTVLLTDPSPLTNMVAVTAHVGTVILIPTAEASVTIGPPIPPSLLQAYCGSSCDPLNGINNGFGGITGDVISSVPGVFSFDPGGPDWRNFVPAFGVVDYTVTNVSLRKTVTPYECSADIGGKSVFQHGTANITTWWPLMYELPGTTFTLTITYTTVSPFDDDGPGPHGATLTHVQVWTWSVGATLQGMKDLLELFHELPLGTHQVPLVSDEVLYPVLQAKLDHIIALINTGQTAEAAIALDEFVLEVEDACISIFTPRTPIASGQGTGIANTCDNPACCKILADADWVAVQLGLRNP